MSDLEILAGHTIDGGRPVVLLLSGGVPVPELLFPDVADAQAFVVWAGDPWRWVRDWRQQRRLGERWRRQRDWPKCPAHDHPEFPCRGRVRPGAELCEDCEGDPEFAAELAAKRGATE